MRAEIAKRLASGIILVVLTTAPRLAEACSVCSMGREDENRIAFLLTTVFLSALPLAMVGSAVWWLRRRVRQMDKEELGARAPGAEQASGLLSGSL